MGLFSKVAFILVSLVLTNQAFADYSCVSQNGQGTLQITDQWMLGTRAVLRSSGVTKFYSYMNLNVRDLKTVVDAGTHKPVVTKLTSGYSFLMHAPLSGTNSVWNLDVTFSGRTASVVLVDSWGYRFSSKFSCAAK